MTQDDFARPGSAFSESGPDGPEMRRIPCDQFAKLWNAEVPKVVERHEAERLQVRRSLGLIS